MSIFKLWIKIFLEVEQKLYMNRIKRKLLQMVHVEECTLVTGAAKVMLKNMDAHLCACMRPLTASKQN